MMESKDPPQEPAIAKEQTPIAEGKAEAAQTQEAKIAKDQTPIAVVVTEQKKPGSVLVPSRRTSADPHAAAAARKFFEENSPSVTPPDRVVTPPSGTPPRVVTPPSGGAHAEERPYVPSVNDWNFFHGHRGSDTNSDPSVKVTSGQNPEEAGKNLYVALRNAFSSGQAAATPAQDVGIYACFFGHYHIAHIPTYLKYLLAYLDVVNQHLHDEDEALTTGPVYDIYINTKRYSEEVKARLNAHKYNYFRKLSDDEMVSHVELVVTLIVRIISLQPEYPSNEAEHQPPFANGPKSFADRCADRGRYVAEKELPTEGWKVAAGCFLTVLGVLTALVAVATVITLAINPATAPAVAAATAAVIAGPIAKFGLEAAIVAGLYFIAELAKKAYDKYNQPKQLLPLVAHEPMTTSQRLTAYFNANKPTKAQAAVKGGAAALVAAPSSIALAEVATHAVINPAAVAITSGCAKAATGSATVATATGTGAVAALTAIPVVFLAGISMMWRGCGLLGDRKLASTLAVKALEQKSVTPLNSQSTPPGARNSNSQ